MSVKTLTSLILRIDPKVPARQLGFIFNFLHLLVPYFGTSGAP